MRERVHVLQERERGVGGSGECLKKLQALPDQVFAHLPPSPLRCYAFGFSFRFHFSHFTTALRHGDPHPGPGPGPGPDPEPSRASSFAQTNEFLLAPFQLKHIAIIYNTFPLPLSAPLSAPFRAGRAYRCAAWSVNRQMAA